MKIYDIEKKMGLEQKILASKTLNFRAKATKDKNPTISSEYKKWIKTEAGKVYASYDDLFFVSAIICSGGVMNLNTDFFPVDELWRAKSTAINKPTNIEHDPNFICGHMIDSWALTEDMKSIIPDSTPESNLPNKIHIGVGGVIYRKLESYYQGEISEIIVGIEAGEVSVSVEAHFEDFDYVLVNKETGEIKVIERNEQTAFLTSLLYFYGGDGVYISEKNNEKEYYTIGRYLKNITLTGKGFVKNPANIDSIILDTGFKPIESDNSKIKSKSILTLTTVADTIKVGENKRKEKIMSEISASDYVKVAAKAEQYDMMKDELGKTKLSLEKYQNDAIANSKTIAEFEVSKKELEKIIEANRVQEEQLKQEIEAAKKKAKMMEDEKTKCSTEIETLKAENARLQKELEEMQAAKAAAERAESLIKEGISPEEAVAFVNSFMGSTPEQFKAVASMKINEHKLIKASKNENKEVAKDHQTSLNSVTPDKDIPGIDVKESQNEFEVFASLMGTK